MSADVPIDPSDRVLAVKRATGRPIEVFGGMSWERWLVKSPDPNQFATHGALVSPCRRCFVESARRGVTYVAYVDGEQLKPKFRSEAAAARAALKAAT